MKDLYFYESPIGKIGIAAEENALTDLFLNPFIPGA